MNKYVFFLVSITVYPLSCFSMGFGTIPETVIQKAETKYGSLVRSRYEAFNTTILKLKDSPAKVKLEEINDFFNQVPYSYDMNTWGKRDYWATPLEFLGKDRGDCEDYVIAKYFALRYLGIESKKLYFSYVRSTRFKEAHMVLTYFETPASIPLVLDNSNFKIFRADQRKDLTPIYNFNGESLYLARQHGEHGKRVKQMNKIHKKWDALINDIKRNKL